MPGLYLRNRVPGEVVLVVSDTGTGKTAWLQHIIRLSRPLTCLLFEMELPSTLLTERFLAAEHKVSQGAVEQTYQDEEQYEIGGLDHIHVCDKARIKTQDIIDTVGQWRLDTGEIPQIIGVDYLGLLGTPVGRSRYERMTEAAVELKRIARETNTILICAVQIHRRGEQDDYTSEIFLHSAKDSSSIEDTADLYLGMWRDEIDKGVVHIKVLKDRKGESGQTTRMRFLGDQMRFEKYDDVLDAGQEGSGKWYDNI